VALLVIPRAYGLTTGATAFLADLRPSPPYRRFGGDATVRGVRTRVRLPVTSAQVAAGKAGMRLQARRRLDMVLLAIAGLLVGGIATAAAAIWDGERVSALWAGAELAGDGSASIVEVIDYDFGVLRRHGIFRDVPGLPSGSLVLVSSDTAPDEVLIDAAGASTRIRIGDAARTISGRHRYRIQYLLNEVAVQRRLAWDAVGTHWPVEVGEAQIDVVGPFEFQDARCVQGVSGSTAPCQVAQPEPGHLVARLHTLRSGQGATLYATGGRSLAVAPRLPVPASGRPADTTSGVLPAGLLAAVITLVGGGVMLRVVRLAGRERVASGGSADAAWGGAGGERRIDAARLASLATIEFTPPSELTPAQGGVVLAEGVQDEHKLAWLIGAAVDGYLEITGDGPTMTLQRLPRDDGSSTAKTLDAIFGSASQLTLGSYHPRFARGWGRIGTELARWERTSGLWDPAGDVHRPLARKLGAVAALGGLAVAAVGAAGANRWSWVWLVVMAWGALLAGAGLAVLVGAWELRVRTARGSGLWLRVESFRRFLAASEAHHAEEAAKRGVLREYTAWAVALGELDRWSKAVAASATAADPVGARYPALAVWLPDATSATLREPPRPSGDDGGWSSGGSGWSGGGSGGGGDVGGGSGGGGGGSW
jgi:hypothetical protein